MLMPKLAIGLDLFAANMSMYGNKELLVENRFKSNLDWHFSILSNINNKLSISYSNSMMFTQKGKVVVGDSILHLTEQGINNQISFKYTSAKIFNRVTDKRSMYPNLGITIFYFSTFKRGQAFDNGKFYKFEGDIDKGILYSKIGWGINGGFFIKNKMNDWLSSIVFNANFEIPKLTVNSSNYTMFDRFFNLGFTYTFYFKMM